jgi:hypothetical protein
VGPAKMGSVRDCASFTQLRVKSSIHPPLSSLTSISSLDATTVYLHYDFCVDELLSVMQ